MTTADQQQDFEVDPCPCPSTAQIPTSSALQSSKQRDCEIGQGLRTKLLPPPRSRPGLPTGFCQPLTPPKPQCSRAATAGFAAHSSRESVPKRWGTQPESLLKNLSAIPYTGVFDGSTLMPAENQPHLNCPSAL